MVENPWEAKLRGSPLYGRVDPKALSLFQRVSADPKEVPLASLKCSHGITHPGYLLLTTHALHWLGSMPKRHDFWHVEVGMRVDSMMTSHTLILETGEQFQLGALTSKGAREFVDFQGVLVRLIGWEEEQGGNAAQAFPPTATPPDPTEQIGRLAQLRDQGAITVEEFESKKAELLDRL